MDIRPLMVIAIFLVMVATIRPMSTRPLEIEQVMGIPSSGFSFAAEGVLHRNEVPIPRRRIHCLISRVSLSSVLGSMLCGNSKIAQSICARNGRLYAPSAGS